MNFIIISRSQVQYYAKNVAVVADAKDTDVVDASSKPKMGKWSEVWSDCLEHAATFRFLVYFVSQEERQQLVDAIAETTAEIPFAGCWEQMCKRIKTRTPIQVRSFFLSCFTCQYIWGNF
jgi:hypothetical protein